MRDYIGFYWTLPVPWAGHQTLPQDVDEAASRSQTIRYQRECVRQWVKENKGKLIEERVFMELEPDRGTEHIVPEVEKALKRCREVGARLLIVDMAASYGWRGHPFLNRVISNNEAFCQRLYPAKIMINGHSFDPVRHFRKWRLAQKKFSASKAERLAAARAAAEALSPSCSNYSELAEALNEEGHLTATGKPWTAENLGKFLKSTD
jgi:hypothetical protein